MIKVLITGAGFTHQFGAPLASSMWELIYNHPAVQTSDYIKQMFVYYINDFETAYQNIVFGKDSSEQDKQAIKSAIEAAYEIIDESCRKPIENNELLDFFIEFLNRDKNKSIIFTLNQDLFLERQFYRLHEQSQIESYKGELKRLGIEPDNITWIKRMGIPIDNIKQQFQLFIKQWRLYANDWITSINNEFQKWNNSNCKTCPYIKLHGSQDLFTNDQQQIMIIGRDKETQLKETQILNAYYDIFCNLLNNNKCKILIIGYSFGDKHINDVLFNSAIKQQSELHIVTKDRAEELLRRKLASFSKNCIRGIYTEGLTKRTIRLLIQNYCRN